jgi:hypothetical protein
MVVREGEHAILWELHVFLRKDIFFPGFNIFSGRHICHSRTGRDKQTDKNR